MNMILIGDEEVIMSKENIDDDKDNNIIILYNGYSKI